MVRFLNNNAIELLPSVWEISSSIYKDDRGMLWSSYHKKEFQQLTGTNLNFIHDKFSYNKKGVLRGIHGDYHTWKLVSCSFGSVFQVVVDLRNDSPTYLSWKSIILSQEKANSVLIPPGFGNAFCSHISDAIYHYKLSYISNYIDCDEQFTVPWNDERLNINWPVKEPILSIRDTK